MIYLENTTETQTIFVSREVQSIENITPITLDSNYYTKTETNEQIANSLNQSKNYTNTEILKLDAEIENINDDIDTLEGRIIDLEENNTSNPPIIIDLGIAVEPNLVLSKEEMIMIADNYMLRDIIIKCKTSSTINDERYFKVLHVEDMRKGGNNRIVVYVGVFFDTSIAYYWNIDIERDTYASMEVYGFGKYASDFEQIKTNTTAITALDSRVTEIENGGSTDKPTHVITIYGTFLLTFAQLSEIKDKFETHKVIIKRIDTKISIIEIINVVFNSTNNNYIAVYGISENKLYEWEYDTTATFINPTITILGGSSEGGDTTELENRVDAIENRTDTIESTYIPQIEANHTLIGYLEQVNIVDVSNGMTDEQFNTIFNNFTTKNYKYLLNVGNDDLFEICSIQRANRSITAIGFDDYEGEMMYYNWFITQSTSKVELTKRKIITEIV